VAVQQQIANCTACGSAATNSKLYGMWQCSNKSQTVRHVAVQQQIVNCAACGSAATNSKLYSMRQQIANYTACSNEWLTVWHAAKISKPYGMRQQIANCTAYGNKQQTA